MVLAGGGVPSAAAAVILAVVADDVPLNLLDARWLTRRLDVASGLADLLLADPVCGDPMPRHEFSAVAPARRSRHLDRVAVEAVRAEPGVHGLWRTWRHTGGRSSRRVFVVEAATGVDVAGLAARVQDRLLADLHRRVYALCMTRAVADVLFGLASLTVRRHQRELSLTATSTLATLERSGPRRLTDLAVSEGVTQPSMTAVVNQLDRRGLAERQADPADGRVRLVAITVAGRAHLGAMRRSGTDLLADLIGKLPRERADLLRDALPALRELLDLADHDIAPPGGAR